MRPSGAAHRLEPRDERVRVPAECVEREDAERHVVGARRRRGGEVVARRRGPESSRRRPARGPPRRVRFGSEDCPASANPPSACWCAATNSAGDAASARATARTASFTPTRPPSSAFGRSARAGVSARARSSARSRRCRSRAPRRTRSPGRSTTTSACHVCGRYVTQIQRSMTALNAKPSTQQSTRERDAAPDQARERGSGEAARSPAEHLPRRPRALAEEEVRGQRRDRAGGEARSRAERGARRDGDDRHGLHARDGGEEDTPRGGDRGERRDEDDLLRGAGPVSSHAAPATRRPIAARRSGSPECCRGDRDPGGRATAAATSAAAAVSLGMAGLQRARARRCGRRRRPRRRDRA